MNKELFVLEITSLQKIQQPKLLEQALTHKSYAMDYTYDIPHNERLEFLGDAVLDTAIAKKLFDDFPKYTESQLTLYKISLVREETLTIVAKEIGLDKYIRISKGEEKSNGRDKPALLSDCLEALIAYCFIEGGYEVANTFILQHIYKHINNIEKLIPVKSYKAQVQEYSQQHYKTLPLYTEIAHTTEQSGNITEYKSELTLNNKKVSEGFAISKKKAQEAAAKSFIETGL